MYDIINCNNNIFDMVNRTQKGKEEIEITSIDKIPYEVLVVGFTIVIVVFAEILFSIF